VSDSDAIKMIATMLLGAMIADPSEVRTVAEALDVSDFPPGGSDVFQVLLDLDAEGKPWDIQDVQARWMETHARKWGNLVPFTCFEQRCLPTQIGTYVQRMLDANAARRLEAIGLGLSQRAGATDLAPSEVITWAEAQIEQVAATLGPPEPVTITTAADVLAYVRPNESFVVPGLIAEQERALITATEGLGKSTLLSQIAVTCAMGLHPFTGVRTGEGARSLHVDLENPEPLAMERWQRCLRTAKERGYPAPRDLAGFVSHTRGIDVSIPADRIWLRRRIEAHRPRLLCIGPLYRMTRAGSLNDEEASAGAQAFLDELRVDYNLAIITEAHSPNESNGQRQMRPIGSSVWRRWPEFGFGMVKDDDLSDRKRSFVAQVGRWRYDRDSRSWPEYIVRTADPSHQWWDDITDEVSTY
jgi:AAA domain